MENYIFNIYKQMQHNAKVHKVSLGRSQKNLIWFLPWCLIVGIIICLKNRVDYIHVGDALLAPLGLLLRFITGARLSVTVYGLDVIYRNAFYQKMIRRFLPMYENIVCISEATKIACIERGVPETSCHVVPCGVDGKLVGRQRDKDDARRLLEKICAVPLVGKTILITVGRLVPRKGVAWFIDNVISGLPNDTLYLVVGNGSEYSNVLKVVTARNLQERVVLLGKVSDSVKDLVYDAADVFVMPNQKIDGDMEGFGIVALEAGIHNVPVIASAIEGIPDAVIDGITGIHVSCKDVAAYKNAILKALQLSSSDISSVVRRRFDWSKIYERYVSIMGLSR